MKASFVLAFVALLSGTVLADGSGIGGDWKIGAPALIAPLRQPIDSSSSPAPATDVPSIPFQQTPDNTTRRNSKRLRQPPLRMPGEFEQQQMLVMSCGELTIGHAETIATIAALARRHVRVLVMYSNDEQQTLVRHALNRHLDSLENISLVVMPHNTKWVRDFGPTVISNRNQPVCVDWMYDESRPGDDHIPIAIASSSQTPIEPMQLMLEGGNLLSNGHGLCLTTSVLLQRNSDFDEKSVRRILRTTLGAREVIVLEPLAGESTGHVDMFATFTSPNTVVVGQYTQEEDAINADILDRNAARLESVTTSAGRLKVVRIPMGGNADGVWRTFTNCIYANGLLLVPFYRDEEDTQFVRAMHVYRRLLPQWQVMPVDATDLILEGGALHCASLNIHRLAKPISLDKPVVPAAPQVVPGSLTGL